MSEELFPIVGSIVLDERDLTVSFSRSSAPGGQNVNKVSILATVSFDFERHPDAGVKSIQQSKDLILMAQDAAG